MRIHTYLAGLALASSTLMAAAPAWAQQALVPAQSEILFVSKQMGVPVEGCAGKRVGVRRECLSQCGKWPDVVYCIQGELQDPSQHERADAQSPNAKQAYDEARKVLTGLADGSVSQHSDIACWVPLTRYRSSSTRTLSMGPVRC